MARLQFALIGLALLAGCADRSPPPELGGLWSTGQAACAAGVGVRFTSDAIEAVYEEERQTLFEAPRYHVEAAEAAFRVRIEYRLPQRPGGARSVGARGELVLVRDGESGLRLSRHNMLDGFTGAARLRIADDPAMQAMQLQPCGPHPWRGGIRGLSAR